MGILDILDAIIDFLYSLFGYRKVTATALLLSSGQPVQGANVTLFWEPSQGGLWNQDGTSVTDGSGTAVSSVHLRRGTYNFRDVFAGNQAYRASSAEKDSVLV